MVNLLEMCIPMLSNVIDGSSGVFQFRSFVSETTNEYGQKVASYSGWATCKGVVAPVQRSKYDELGLDFAKNYITIYGSVTMDTVNVNKRPSQVKWQGKIYNVTAATPWNVQNGWVTITACEDKTPTT